ncbi:hypothetical protein BGZ60DRAFT_535547 [Tricladium varicosporioides]|nr:hypothetical protein BGZ60DRAFT_535547 [Hymenoscyphus varicosporioides]
MALRRHLASTGSTPWKRSTESPLVNPNPKRGLFSFLPWIPSPSKKSENIDIAQPAEPERPPSYPIPALIPIASHKQVPLKRLEQPQHTAAIDTHFAKVAEQEASTTANQFHHSGQDPPFKRIDHSRPTRFNKERIFAPIAAPIKMPKWQPWTERELQRDMLQRRSYTQDQSIIEPGQVPEPPLYSVSRELILSVGDSMPEIYAQRLTATDILELQQENQTLRNKVLGGITDCPLCDSKFEPYKKDEISKHFKEHSDALAAASICPICEIEDWVFMNTDQKRTHLMDHHSREDSKVMQNFWADHSCPVCDIPLHPLGNPQAILAHVAEHTPGVLQYCDHCGVHLKSMSGIEQHHHQQVCLDQPDKAPGEKDLEFCDVCGKDRSDSSEEEIAAHRRYCRRGKGIFCGVCQFNLAEWPLEVVQRHMAQCKPPRGFQKKFCRRCGVKLYDMNIPQAADHRNTCYLQEGNSSGNDLRKKYEDLQRSICHNELLHSKLNVEKSRLHQQAKALKKREEDISIREAKQSVTDFDNSRHCPQTQGCERSAYEDDTSSDEKHASTANFIACPFGPPCTSNSVSLTTAEKSAHFKDHLPSEKLPQKSLSTSLANPISPTEPTSPIDAKSTIKPVTPSPARTKSPLQPLHSPTPFAATPTTSIRKSLTKRPRTPSIYSTSSSSSLSSSGAVRTIPSQPPRKKTKHPVKAKRPNDPNFRPTRADLKATEHSSGESEEAVPERREDSVLGSDFGSRAAKKGRGKGKVVDPSFRLPKRTADTVSSEELTSAEVKEKAIKGKKKRAGSATPAREPMSKRTRVVASAEPAVSMLKTPTMAEGSLVKKNMVFKEDLEKVEALKIETRRTTRVTAGLKRMNYSPDRKK